MDRDTDRPTDPKMRWRVRGVKTDRQTYATSTMTTTTAAATMIKRRRHLHQESKDKETVTKRGGGSEQNLYPSPGANQPANSPYEH